MTAKDGQTKAPIRMLIADVDGTLVTQEKVLTKRAADAVLSLHDAGVEFSVTSGRPPRGMAMLIEPLKLTQPLAAFNGGVLIKPDLTTVVDQKFFPPGVPEQVIEAIENHGLDVWLYTDTGWFVRDANAAHVAREQWTVKFPPSVGFELQPLPFPLLADHRQDHWRPEPLSAREPIGSSGSAQALHHGQQLVFHGRRKKGSSRPRSARRLGCSLCRLFFDSRRGDQASGVGAYDRGWKCCLCHRRILKTRASRAAGESKLVPRERIWRLRKGPGAHPWYTSLRCLFARCCLARWSDASAPPSARRIWPMGTGLRLLRILIHGRREGTK